MNMGLTVRNVVQDCDTSDTKGGVHGNYLYYRHNFSIYLRIFPKMQRAKLSLNLDDESFLV